MDQRTGSETHINKVYVCISVFITAGHAVLQTGCIYYKFKVDKQHETLSYRVYSTQYNTVNCGINKQKRTNLKWIM